MRVHRAMWGTVNLRRIYSNNCNPKKYARFLRRLYVCEAAYKELAAKVKRNPFVPLGEMPDPTPITKEYRQKFNRMKRLHDKKSKAHKKYIARKKPVDLDEQPWVGDFYCRMFDHN